MRNQIGACDVQCSLGVNINGACCYVPDEYHYIFVLSKIYMIYSEAIQNDVGKKRKGQLYARTIILFSIISW